MTLSITSNLNYDEALAFNSTDVNGDTDSNVASLSAALQAQIDALSLTYFSSPTGFPQYAEMTNFVSSTNPVTNYTLASDSAGDGFSTTTGVATSLYVGSDQISLYATSDPNVVVGRVGGATGDVVLTIALNETTDGTGHVSGTDLGVTVYAPLVHADGTKVDDADTLNLSGLIYLYDTYSTITISEFNDFSKVPSGNDAFALIGPSSGSTGADLLVTGFAGTTEGTVNVSTTGLGANSQTVDNGASLRVDIVSANATDFAMADTSPEVHNPANISFENYVQSISAGFELTQNNPTGKLASLTVSAYEVGTVHTGTDYVSHVFDGSLVTIDPSMVVIKDNAGHDITSTFGGTITQSSDGKSVLITGLAALDHVSFTATSEFDRFTITNTQTSPSDKTTFDVGDITVSTVTGGVGHESTDIGDNLVFEDGGPSVSATAATVPTVTVDESTLGVAGSNHGDFSGLFSVNYGPDGAASSGSLDYTLGIKSSGVDSGLKDTATGHEIFLYMDGSNVVGRVGSSTTTADPTGTIDFTISAASDGTVTFQQDHAVIHSDPTATDEPATLASSDLVTLTATAHDGDGDSASSPAANIGTAFTILDDEPASLGTGTNLFVGNSLTDLASPAFPHTASGSFTTFDAGNDGVGSYTFVGPADSSGDYQWSYNDTSHTSITETYKGAQLFSLSLDSSTGGYSMTMLGTLPDTQLFLDANKIHAAGPTSHTLDVGTTTGTDDVLITSQPGPINASNGNVGVTNGNLDSGESLEFQLYTDISHTTLIPFFGIDIGTKSAQSATYNVTGQIDAADGGGTYTQNNIPVGKNGTIHVDTGNILLDSITVTDASGNAIKIGISTIALLLPPADAGFHFTAQLADGDGDTVSSSFNTFIDGNNDGVVDTAHVLFPA